MEQIQAAAALLEQGLLTAAEFGALKRQAIAAGSTLAADRGAERAQLPVGQVTPPVGARVEVEFVGGARYGGAVVARGCGPGRACFRVAFVCDGTAEHVRPGAHRYRVLQPPRPEGKIHRVDPKFAS